MADTVQFEDADAPGRTVAVDADPQTAVTAGDRPGTAVLVTPDGRRFVVAGDYRDVKVKLQAAAARGHEAGTAPRTNTPVG
jgi:hypothetical protein